MSKSDIKDPDYLIKLEKSIQQKYGDEVIQHPFVNWSDEKEKNFLEDLKKSDKFFVDKEQSDVNKLFTEERFCSICNVYSFFKKDDIYMIKFKCCYKCYVYYFEGREDKKEEIQKKLKKEYKNYAKKFEKDCS